MNSDQTFRAVLIVVFLVVLPIGLYHRLKSQPTRETLDRALLAASHVALTSLSNAQQAVSA